MNKPSSKSIKGYIETSIVLIMTIALSVFSKTKLPEAVTLTCLAILIRGKIRIPKATAVLFGVVLFSLAVNLNYFDIGFRAYLFAGLLFMIVLRWSLDRLSEYQTVQFLRSYMIISALISLLALIDLHFDVAYLDLQYHAKQTNRITGFFQDPNFFGFYLTIGFYIAIFEVRGSRLLRSICLALTFLAIVWTKSRAAYYVCFLLSFVALFRLTFLTRNRLSGVAWALPFAFLFIPLFLTFNLEFLPMKVALQRITEAGTSGRVDIWIEYLDRLKAYQLTVGDFGFYNSSFRLSTGLPSTHNSILQVILNFGLAGTPVLLFLMFGRHIAKASYLVPRLCLFIPQLLSLDLLFSRSFWILLFILTQGNKKENIVDEERVY